MVNQFHLIPGQDKDGAKSFGVRIDVAQDSLNTLEDRAPVFLAKTKPSDRESIPVLPLVDILSAEILTSSEEVLSVSPDLTGISIDDIQPQSILHVREFQTNEIRERLKADGRWVFNKQLPAPWDFNAVLVVSPREGAGVDDFLREANRLETFGICKFSYIYSQFESENVADEIRAALQQALHEWGNTMNVQPDAIIMICSAETPNAMTWLNNDELACFICDLPIPVLTGLGNTHGNTILDEVTHSQFETPIQVMNAIQQRVATRSTEARNNFELLLHNAAKKIKSAQLIVGVMEMTVKAEADRHLAQGKQSAIDLLATIHMDAQQEACATAQQSREMLQVLKDETMAHLSKAKLHVLSLWRPITQSAIQDSTSAELSKKVGVTRIKAMLNEISVDDIQYPDTVVSGTTEKYFQGESHDQPII